STASDAKMRKNEYRYLDFYGFLFLALLTSATAAEEKKPQKTNEPPRIFVVLPLGAVPGVTNNIKIRGLNLTNVTELRFASLKEAVYKIKSAGKADVPTDQDANKCGDTQLHIEPMLPATTPAG